MILSYAINKIDNVYAFSSTDTFAEIFSYWMCGIKRSKLVFSTTMFGSLISSFTFSSILIKLI